MATVLIPELIEPGSLYAPAANNFFSIASADLPNGDDALIMGGASGRYKAYQAAVSGIHYDWGANEAAISFWIKPASTLAGVGNATMSGVLFGVQNSAETTTGVLSVTGHTFGPNTAWVCVGNSGTLGDRRIYIIENRHYAAGNAADPGTTETGTATPLASAAWTFVVFNRATTGQWTCYRNAVLANTGPVPSAIGPTALNAGQFFSLGAYSAASGPNNAALNTGLAKLAIHDRQLTVQEMLDLYDSMINGPPSP